MKRIQTRHIIIRPERPVFINILKNSCVTRLVKVIAYINSIKILVRVDNINDIRSRKGVERCVVEVLQILFRVSEVLTEAISVSVVLVKVY